MTDRRATPEGVGAAGVGDRTRDRVQEDPENGWIDLTQPLPDETPPLSEKHQRQVCRLLNIPYELEKSARTKAYVRWRCLNKAAMDAEDRGGRAPAASPTSRGIVGILGDGYLPSTITPA
jgi:hypothetical protein